MQQSTVATRYAKAFFELVEEQGMEEVRKACAVLEEFKRAMSESKSLELLAKNPVLTSDEKKKVLQAILVKLEAKSYALQFFNLLVDKQRLDLLPEIANQFRGLLDKAEGISRGVLTTAIALDESRQRSIITNLEKQLGCKLALTFTVDPALIGGTLIKLGDIVLDSSLATQINNLSQTIKRGGGE